MRLIEQEEKKAKAEINKWKNRHDNEINILFEQQLTSAEVERVGASGLGFKQQVSRLRGLDFGSVNHEFRTEIEKIKLGSNSNSNKPDGVSMELAIENVNRSGKEIKMFTIYFKTVVDGDEKYWKQNLDQEFTDFRNYDVMAKDPRPSKKRFGISIELRNQLSYNWGALPFSLLGDLFYALTLPSSLNSKQKLEEYASDQISKGIPLPTIEKNLLLSRGWVRAHSYQITGNNLAAFKALISEGGDDAILRTTFGANLTDAYIGTDVFTVIIEIDPDGSQKDSDYLEFVHACPPFCDP